MIEPQTARGGFHTIDVLDGVVGRRLKCARCYRSLPEDSFARVGHSWHRHRSVVILHPLCHSCRKQAKGKWVKHPEYSAKLDRYWSSRLAQIKAGAGSRGLMVTIDKDDLLGKYLEQEGRCAISGLKMDPFGSGAQGKSGQFFSAPSVDRIDSNGHYTFDNIQIVMHVVNIMKGELPGDVFIELCATIADRHRF